MEAPVAEAVPELRWTSFEDDQGGFFVLWARPEGSVQRILAQHVARDGANLWSAGGITLVSDLDAGGDWGAFADSKSGFGVVWVREGKVVAHRWGPDGHPLWNAPVTLSDARFKSSSPAGMADGAGGFFAVWAEKSFADRSVLMAQHLNALGAALWAPSAVRVSLRPSDQRNPDLLPDGAAGFLVSWADYRDMASDWRLQRMNYQGFRLWGLEGVQVAAPAGSESVRMRMAPWGQGSVAMVWTGNLQGKSRVLDLRLDPRGQLASDRSSGALPPGEQWNPVIAGDGQGRFWIGWEDNRNERNWQVFLRPHNGEAQAAAPSSADQGHLALAEDGSGGVFAAWVEARKGSPSVFVLRRFAEGNDQWPGGKEVAAGLKRPGVPRLLLLEPGRAALFWTTLTPDARWALSWTILS